MEDAEGVQVYERARIAGQGLRLLLRQKTTFPQPIRVWNPKMKIMEYKKILETFFDASIPEEIYSAYEGYMPGRDSKSRILILLSMLGYSYPTTAVSEATGVARTTVSRLLWELGRDGLVEGRASTGQYIDSEMWPYRYGPIRENYWMLTDKGAEQVVQILEYRVVPLAPLGDLVKKEMAEHPWLKPEEAERIVREHQLVEERTEALKRKQARGEQLSAEELKFLYGEKARVEEPVAIPPLLKETMDSIKAASDRAEAERKRLESRK